MYLWLTVDNCVIISDVENEAIKDELFGEFGFTFDQITEMQGLSIASAIFKTYPIDVNKTTKVLICCGSELLGKSGLVAARHLKLFVSLLTLHTFILIDINTQIVLKVAIIS